MLLPIQTIALNYMEGLGEKKVLLFFCKYHDVQNRLDIVIITFNKGNIGLPLH